MRSTFFILTMLLLHFCAAYAQNTGTLTGNLQTEEGRSLADAHLKIDGLPLSTTTDRAGNFIFKNIPAGYHRITGTHLGYQISSQEVTITAGASTTIQLFATAQASQLDPVIITAEKRENTLQKVPMSVSALDAKSINERKINEMSDLLMSVPNLMSMNLGSPTLNMISIRGVNTFSTDPVVGVYVDGIPLFDGYSSSMQIQNIERIEILRGPQSTLYGRNALGGVMNIITAKPSNTLHGYAQLGFGNYGQQRYTAGVSGALIKNKLFAGISGVYDRRDGFFTNLYDQTKFDKPKTTGGSIYLKYLATDKLSFTLNTRGEYNNVTGTFPYTFAGTAESHPFTVNQNGTNIEKRKLLTSSLLISYKTSALELSSTTGHTYMSDKFYDYDVDYSPYQMLSFEIPNQPQNTFTQEFKIVTDQNKRLKFTGGLFGFADRKKSQTRYNYGPDAVASYPDAPFSSDIFSDKKVYGLAAYAHATFSLTPKLDLIAGLRYDYEHRTLTHSTEYLKSPNPAVVVSPETTIKGNNDAVSPKLGLSYQANDALLIYASYARGYRSGGFNQYTAQANKLNYKPEFTGNYELGLKSEWLNHRIRANVALFYINWKDQQQAVAFPDMVTDNVGKLTNTGAELELTALVAKGLEFRYNLGIVHSDYKKLILSDGAGNNRDYAGNKQIFTPSFSSSLSATYRRSFAKTASLFFTPEWKLLGKQYMNYYNDLIQDSFSLVNATAGVKLGLTELSIWAKNIGDVHYLSFAYATSVKEQSPVGQGAPRTFGASLKVSF